jgi:DNA-binding protein WhiA
VYTDLSFAARTKKELTQLELKPCCKRAELAAMFRMNGAVSIGNNRFSLDVTTENAAIARRMYTLLKELFGVHAELLVRKKMRLKKNNIYMMRIPFGADKILQELGLVNPNMTFVAGINEDLVKKPCCKRSYLRGTFMAGGSVNDPEGSSYHLEISSSDLEHSEALVEHINQFGLNAKLIDRKNSYVVYLKEVEKIIEFLNIIGAHQALLRFEDVRIVKGMRNQVNRLVNCETANLNKTIEASVRQIENIKLLASVVGLQNLPLKLREVAELRLQYPDINLKELGEMLPSPVSKSGVNHRLRKLDEMAEKLKLEKGE